MKKIYFDDKKINLSLAFHRQFNMFKQDDVKNAVGISSQKISKFENFHESLSTEKIKSLFEYYNNGECTDIYNKSIGNILQSVINKIEYFMIDIAKKEFLSIDKNEVSKTVWFLDYSILNALFKMYNQEDISYELNVLKKLYDRLTHDSKYTYYLLYLGYLIRIQKFQEVTSFENVIDETGVIYQIIATAHYANGKYLKAIKYLQKSLIHFTENTNLKRIFLSNIYIAACYSELHSDDLALEVINSVRSIYDVISDKSLRNVFDSTFITIKFKNYEFNSIVDFHSKSSTDIYVVNFTMNLIYFYSAFVVGNKKIQDDEIRAIEHSDHEGKNLYVELMTRIQKRLNIEEIYKRIIKKLSKSHYNEAKNDIELIYNHYSKNLKKTLSN